MNKLKLYYPLYPWNVIQPFGVNPASYAVLGINGHNGLDAVRGYLNGHEYVTDGANVRAAHDGIVVYTGIDSKAGYGVVIRTLDAFDYNGAQVYFKSIYWHLKPLIKVKVGQKVSIGDIIGNADTTGFFAGSYPITHLHFGLKPIAQGENEWTWMNFEQNNGYAGAIDPTPYFVGMSAYGYLLKHPLKFISSLIK